MKNVLKFAALILMVVMISSCKEKKDEVQLNYEQYTLDNGLKVVLHQDHSDPIVSVATQFHVGSAREKEGKTGFAHFFEHMLFQRSENLPRNAFFQKISEYGGNFNGGTSNDGTVYYEVVPRDALEKVLWMESDRMGYFINTVTQAGLEREIDVILNEKRQGVDNAPYGQMEMIMCEELFPKGHPYSWSVIGQMADISSATVEDVKEFYANYYVPANATLVIAGDFDMDQAKELVNKYYAEIPSHSVEKPAVWNITLDQTKKVEYEDPFASMPEVSIAYPTVESFSEDECAIDLLMDLLAGSKNSPLYKTIVEGNLAPGVSAYNYCLESAGAAYIDVRSYPATDLDSIYAAIEKGFRMFEENGVDPVELQMNKVMMETQAYNSISSVYYKSIMMANSNEFAGSPDAFLKQIKKYKAVTAEDIMRVYEKYIKGKNFVAVSIVPAGQPQLALEGSTPAHVVIEDVASQKMTSKSGAIVDDDYQHTASKIDRSVEPAFLPNTPVVTVPTPWSGELANGLKVQGFTQNEIPLVTFTLFINGGQLVCPQKPGIASLNASMMNQGTALRTATEIEQALSLLGASLRVSGTLSGTTVSGVCLAENFEKVMEILDEMITSPRFDEEIFNREKNKALANVQQKLKSPGSIADANASKLYFGEDCVFANAAATTASLNAMTMDDIKAYYNTLSPKVAAISVAGAIKESACKKALAKLAADWKGESVDVPAIVLGQKAETSNVYFIDYPDAKQSNIFVMGKGRAYKDSDYYALDVLNFQLGEGSNGELFNVLRLQRGYTYGAYSSFVNQKDFGYFYANSSVQSSATKESVELFKSIFSSFGDNYTEDMLKATKDAMIRQRAFQFETQNSLVGLLNRIYKYNLSINCIADEQQVINDMTLDKIKELSKEYLDPTDMIIVVVGDAKTQLKGIKDAKLIESMLK